MKAIILLFFCIIYCSFISEYASAAIIFATEDNKKKTESEKKKVEDKEDCEYPEEDEKSGSDTVNYNSYSSEIWDINDSIMNIPAYDLYCNWDNFVIHPYKYDLTKKKDTTFVFLQDENKCDYYHPVIGDITSNFGQRGSRYHYGIDIKLETGDSVHNAFEGTVRIAKKSYTYGNVVVVRHNNGLETLYAHLDNILVEPGDAIEAGDLIGYGGNTGRSSGSHLHFEVRYKGEAINPNDLICFKSNELKKDTLAIDRNLFGYLTKVNAAKYHTIKKGDTLSEIASNYRTSVSKLCKLNLIKSSAILKPGRKLRYI